jgi:hypothetical protein
VEAAALQHGTAYIGELSSTGVVALFASEFFHFSPQGLEATASTMHCAPPDRWIKH